MPILEFESSAAKEAAPKKPLKLILGAGVLVGALALGSTFAANINLNGNNNVEFGQGVVTTAACDPDGITVTPFSTFINASPSASPAARFELGSIVFSGIDTTACNGKTFTIKAFGATGGALVLVNSTVDEILVSLSTGAFTEAVNETGVTVANNQDGLGFTITLDSLYSPIAADQVYKITIESKDSVDAAPISYSVGDTGPSGGIIFYVAETPFVCGPTLNEVCQYLEAAPNNWSGRGLTEEDPRITWAAEDNQSTSVAGALGTAIGTGYANSLAIAGQAGNDATNSAAALALGYSFGGEEDWYLPSSEELRELWKIRVDPHNILLFFSYWSSTQNANNPGQAWDSGGDSPAAGGQKYSTTMVRPIRAFSGSLT